MKTEVTVESRNLLDASRAFAGARPAAFVRAVLFDYAVIALAMGTAVWFWQSPAFWLLLPVAWVVIASRQHALLVLLHDATHYLASPNRWVNEILGEFVCGLPLAVNMHTYRKDHLAHHRHVNTPDDPDWRRKRAEADEAARWDYPRQMNWWQFWQHSVVYLWHSLRDNSQHEASRPSLIPHLGTIRLALLALILGAVVVSGSFGWFVVLWLVPLVFVLPAIMRLRSVAEHFALPGNALAASRNVHASWYERFLLAPHNVGLHLDHHLVASVSFSQLPKLHEKLEAMDALAGAHQNDGYFAGRRSLLRDMQQPVSLPAA